MYTCSECGEKCCERVNMGEKLSEFGEKKVDEMGEKMWGVAPYTPADR